MELGEKWSEETVSSLYVKLLEGDTGLLLDGGIRWRFSLLLPLKFIES